MLLPMKQKPNKNKRIGLKQLVYFFHPSGKGCKPYWNPGAGQKVFQALWLVEIFEKKLKKAYHEIFAVKSV